VEVPEKNQKNVNSPNQRKKKNERMGGKKGLQGGRYTGAGSQGGYKKEVGEKCWENENFQRIFKEKRNGGGPRKVHSKDEKQKTREGWKKDNCYCNKITKFFS